MVSLEEEFKTLEWAVFHILDKGDARDKERLNRLLLHEVNIINEVLAKHKGEKS